MRKIIYSVSAIMLILVIVLIIVIIISINKGNITSKIQEINYEYDKVDNYYNEVIELSKRIKKNATREEKEIINSYYSHPRKALTELCKKNGNWELIPIADELYEIYNEKDGILGNEQFDSIEGIDEKNDVGMGIVVTTSGKQKTRYLIDFSYSTLIQNVKVYERVELTDKDGNELDTRYRFVDKQVVYNFNSLCDDGNVWEDGSIIGEDIAITPKFREKYPLFLDLFTHYSPLEYNPITFVEKKSKLNNHMAYFIVTSVLECKEREYEVYYQLDENNYLDDAHAVCVKERELEPDNKNSGTKAFYLNSNLDNANLSDEFKQYIKKHGSYNSDIKDIYINDFAEEVCLDEGRYTKFIRCYKMNNGDINSYYVEYMFDNSIISNIISTKLPYKNMSAKEVKELYLKDIENKND